METKTKKPALKFLVLSAVSFGMVFIIRQPEFTGSQLFVIFLPFFSISLWITEAIPPFTVSLLAIAFLVFAQGNEHFNSAPGKTEKYVNTFSSSVIWLFDFATARIGMAFMKFRDWCIGQAKKPKFYWSVGYEKSHTAKAHLVHLNYAFTV